jgi:flagellin
MTLSTFQVGHKSGETISVGLSDMSADAIGKSGTQAVAEVSKVSFAGNMHADDEIDIVLTQNSVATTFTVAGSKTGGAAIAAAFAALTDSDYTFEQDGNELVITSKNAGTAGAFTMTAAAIHKAADEGTKNAGTTAIVEYDENTTAAAAAASNASGTFIEDIAVTDGTAAALAITALDNALVSVGQERAKLGAFQNRLTHAVNNMTNMSANTAAAKSIIADADYAQESSSLAKNQILQQAGTAMLAQANAQAQSVLSLLK